MDIPSFEGFHTELDCKLTCGNKNHSCSIYRFVFKNKTEQNRNDEKYSQTGITVKTHTKHDGVMLRSNAASSSWRYPVIAVK